MSRWVVHSQARFDAVHALSRYRGEPEPSHGHQWRVSITVGTNVLNDEGYALDFHQVHEILAQVVKDLDGCDLNAHPEIGRSSPTAERVAEVLADRLTPLYTDLGGTLLSVSVWEGEENRVDLNLGEDAR